MKRLLAFRETTMAQRLKPQKVVLFRESVLLNICVNYLNRIFCKRIENHLFAWASCSIFESLVSLTKNLRRSKRTLIPLTTFLHFLTSIGPRHACNKLLALHLGMTWHNTHNLLSWSDALSSWPLSNCRFCSGCGFGKTVHSN